MRPTNYATALAWIDAHVDYERLTHMRREVPTLDPIRATLAQLADPQLDYDVLHITGTNGKGTTTTLASQLLHAHGLRVGTFTSPDLHAINERIAVNGEAIDDASLTTLMARLYDVEAVSGIVLTRFEILTVAALLHFSDEGIDAAVIEVGMGGTWDSTNVIDGVVSVLTNVDLDHVGILGNTIEEIARDKVGIFRTGGVAVVATTDPTVVAIAQAQAEAVDSAVLLFDRDFVLERNDLAIGGRAITLRTTRAYFDDVLVRLHGIHQGINAATAIVAVEAFLDRPLDEDVVRHVLSTTSMPGRLEVLSTAPTIVVDGAHNPAGIRALCAALDGAFHVTGDLRVIIGMLIGRNVDDMVAPLLRLGVSSFLCVTPNSPRAMAGEEVAAAITRGGGTAVVCPSVMMAVAQAREHSQADDLIVIAGSLYVVAEARQEILHISSRH